MASASLAALIFFITLTLDQAAFSKAPEAVAVFRALGTQDFEVAIKALESAAQILPAYVAASGDAQALMLQHAGELKDILLEAYCSEPPPDTRRNP